MAGDSTRVCEASADATNPVWPGSVGSDDPAGPCGSVVIRVDGQVNAELLSALRQLGVALREHGDRLTVTTGNSFTRWVLGATLLDRTIDVRWNPGSPAGRKVA